MLGGAAHVVSVLLLEDENTDAEFVRKTLVPPPGVEFHVARRRLLSEAMDYISHNEVDVALVDLNLPDSSGHDTFLELRRGGLESPIVVLTSINDSRLSDTLLADGAEEIVRKWDLGGPALSRSLLYVVERHRHTEHIKRVAQDHVDATFVVEPDGKISFANDAAGALLGQDSEELQGSNFPYPLDVDRSTEIRIPLSDGERHLEVRSTVIDWNRGQAYLASVRDITDRVRAEELRRRVAHMSRLASMGQLAAGVAHELNNPVAFIRANLETMKEGSQRASRALLQIRTMVRDDSSALAQKIDTILAESEVEEYLRDEREMVDDNLEGTNRIASIISEFRVFSRVDCEEYARLQLKDLVKSACNMVRNEITHRAQFVRELETVPEIVGDRAKLTQVITNLLVNAAQAIEPGHVGENKITVRLREFESEVVISVEDTGSGIPDHLQQKIFEPFFTTKPRHVGTGLGLSLSAEIVRKHAGTIDMASSSQGTRFEVRLPLNTNLTPNVRVSRAPESNTDRHARRVLVVDDDRAILRAVQRHLVHAYGYEVVTSSVPEDALEIVAQGSFDVVICDLMMPDMDGLHFYDTVQHRLSERRPAFVFLSGGVFSQRIRDSVDAGDVPLVPKPIDFEDLARAINTAKDLREAGNKPLGVNA